jgi:prophage antirepressor-like protein
VDAEDRSTADPRLELGSRSNVKVNIVNESGLYSLILKSRKPEAKAFKKWVTSEVLPSIRKTGMYMTKEAAPAISTIKI